MILADTSIWIDYLRGQNDRLMGRGIGWVDANLLASVSQDSAKLWTRDKRLNAIAQDLNLVHVSE
jgi:hypothetical protein